MPATLNLQHVSQLAQNFPNAGWHTIETQIFIADRYGEIKSDWSATRELAGVGGVYAILLPVVWFQPHRTIVLHATHNHQGQGIPYEFTLTDATGNGYGVAYVGRTTNLRQRWRGHLTKGERKDGGQVKYGLSDCNLYEIQDQPERILRSLRELRQHGKIIYTALPGDENCANRDMLEMALCARFGPPFNIKAER